LIAGGATDARRALWVEGLALRDNFYRALLEQYSKPAAGYSDADQDTRLLMLSAARMKTQMTALPCAGNACASGATGAMSGRINFRKRPPLTDRHLFLTF
jgi:hypothetical protein